MHELATTRLDATPMQVALAWPLQRSPNILLIPGTSSVAHLRENMVSAALTLPENELAQLNGIAEGRYEVSLSRAGAWTCPKSRTYLPSHF